METNFCPLLVVIILFKWYLGISLRSALLYPCWVAAEYKTVQYVFILEGSGLFLYSLNQAVLVAVVVVIIIELSLFLSVNM